MEHSHSNHCSSSQDEVRLPLKKRKSSRKDFFRSNTPSIYPKPIASSQSGRTLPSNQSESPSTSADGKPFTCDQCGNSFSDRTKLTAHEKRHANVANRRYQCKDCGKCLTQKSSLTMHIETHTDKRRFKCPSCDAGFNDASSLRKHEFIHKGEHPFKCRFGGGDFCKRGFTQSGNRNRHERVRHWKKLGHSGPPPKDYKKNSGT